MAGLVDLLAQSATVLRRHPSVVSTLILRHLWWKLLLRGYLLRPIESLATPLVPVTAPTLDIPAFLELSTELPAITIFLAISITWPCNPLRSH